jgi:signal transduction histidine kinase
VQGESVWQVSSYLAEAASPDGRVIVVAYDVTRITKLEAMLRRNEIAAAMGAMVAGVAHEVRNPLFTISAAIDAWEARYGDSEGMRRYAGPLREQVGRLNRLMSDLLEYGKPHPLAVQEASLAQPIRAAASDCAAVAAERGASIAVDLAADLPPAMIDTPRIEQVFQNIIDNALRHSPAGSMVRVEATLEDGGFTCRVLDEGPGLSAEDIAHAFVPFYTRRRGGTGLGLAIARNIVMGHGGKITLANRHDRDGAIVTIRLPLTYTEEAPEARSAAW